MGATNAARSLKAIVVALLAACAIALCAALPGQAWGETYEAEIGDVKFGTLQGAVDAASSGDTIEIIAAGTYSMPKFKNMELTFKGNGSSDIVLKDYVEPNWSQDLYGSTIHFVDLTIQGATENYRGLIHTAKVTYDNCDIKGLRFLYAPEVAFNNCDFDSNGQEHSFWTYSAKSVKVTDCNFTYADRAVNCYGDTGSYSTDISFVGCKFTYSGASAAPEGAVEINSSENIPINLSFESCTAPDKGEMWFVSRWDAEKGVYTTVKEAGEVVWPVYVAQIGDAKYTSLQKAVDAADDGDTITVIADHELIWDGETKVDGLPVFVAVDGKAVTIDLNGKKVTGTSGASNNALYAAFAVDNDGNLTLKDSGVGGSVKITGTNTMYSLLMAYEDGANKTTTLTVEGGSYYLEKAHDCLIFCGEPNDANDLVYIKGGSFELGNLGVGENGKPWTFNVVGSADHHANVMGGTFDANVQRQFWANEVKVSETCYMQDNGDGTWTVKDGAGVYAKEGILSGPHYIADWTVGYASLQAFVDAANANAEDTVDLYDPITLLKDAEVAGALVLGSGEDYKVDCNGHNIILTDAAASLTAPEGLSVITNVNDGKVVYENGMYKVSIERKILEGEGGVWTVGSTNGLGFKCSGEFNLFAGVTVDGKTVDRTNYEAAAGSTVVTLKPAYLSTLSVGQHELVFKYADNTSAAAKFEVKAASSNAGGEGDSKSESDSKSDALAKTGDATGMVAAGAGIVLAAAGAIALIARRRVA